MMTIISDILDVPKIEAGQLDLNVTDFVLHETVEQACAVASLEANAKGIELELEMDPEVARTGARRQRTTPTGASQPRRERRQVHRRRHGHR